MNINGALVSSTLVLMVVGCGPKLHFRHVNALGATRDAKTQSTKVSLTFEVWDGDEQLTNLSRESFTVYEDGHPATSESLNEAGTTERRTPVVLLLDTSLSMYQANAIVDLKKAAARFAASLEDNGFDVTVYRFASKVEQVADIGMIPDRFDEAVGERWTSLYAAISYGFSRHQDAMLVVFSDGADNYSQNLGIQGLRNIEGWVLPGGKGGERVLHAIGFGNVKGEKDRQGISAIEALKRLARNGAFHYAEQSGAFDKVFDDVARRIRNIYVYDYFSPNLSGTHVLVIEVQTQGRKARTRNVTFTAGGGAAAGGGTRADAIAQMKRACENSTTGGECTTAAAYARTAGRPSEALELIRKGCAKGDRFSCQRALMKKSDGGILERGAPMIRELCRQDHYLACVTLAEYSIRTKDWKAAVESLRRARGLHTDGAKEKKEDLDRLYVYALYPLMRMSDPKAAVPVLQAACDEDVAMSCAWLATLYRDGRHGIPHSAKKAKQGYQKACDMGEQEGCVGLAVLTMRGLGEPKNPKRAATLLKGLCEQGKFNACGYLGQLNVKGEGVAKDYDKGVTMIRAACKKGHTYSCDFLDKEELEK